MRLPTPSNILTACCYSLFLVSCSIFASAKNDISPTFALTELDYLESVPVVLSATRLSQPIDAAPAAITVITKKMIDASGAQEIGDLLRLVPGFQVGYFNGIAMSLTYHGFSGNYDRRLQVLIDGRSVYMPMLSTVEWLSLPVDISEIEKIEVIRSSNTPVFGANSFKGVINIITRKPFQDAGFSVQATVGSHDVGRSKNLVEKGEWRAATDTIASKKTILRFANSLNKLDFRVTLGYQEDPGFDEVEDSKSLSILRFVGGYQTSINDRLDIQLGIREGNMDTFADGSSGDPHRTKKIESSYQSLGWTSALNSDDELSLRIYHNYYKQDDQFTALYWDIIGNPPLEALPIEISSVVNQEVQLGIYHGIAERFDVEFQYTKKIFQNLRSVVSTGARIDRLKSKYLLSKEGYVSDRSARAAVNLEWYIRDWLVMNSGLMVERNDQIGVYYSPRIALNSKFSNSHIFRVSATHALRTPSILENHLYLGCCQVDGNPPGIPVHISAGDLAPEKLDSIEFGYIYLPSLWGLTFDVKMFWENIADGILESSNESVFGNPWVWGNNTKAETYGIESQISYQAGSKFLLHLGHSYLDTNAKWHKKFNTGNLTTEYVDISDSIPSHTFNVLTNYQLLSSVNWSFAYYWMSEINWLQDGSALPKQDRLDTKLSWTKKISQEKKFEISLVLQNILDNYIEVQKETLFERRGFLSVVYDW